MAYVRQGGKLVICQSTEKYKIEPLAELCPRRAEGRGG